MNNVDLQTKKKKKKMYKSTPKWLGMGKWAQLENKLIGAQKSLETGCSKQSFFPSYSCRGSLPYPFSAWPSIIDRIHENSCVKMFCELKRRCPLHQPVKLQKPGTPGITASYPPQGGATSLHWWTTSPVGRAVHFSIFLHHLCYLDV